jgi:ATP synthase protein I
MAKPNNDGNMVRILGQASMTGLMFGACILVGTLLGYWLDRRLGTRPWLTLILMVFGIVAGFYNAIRIVQSLNKSK